MSSRTVVFLGPTLDRSTVLATIPDAEIAPPAAQGDLHAATLSDADTIVLVDGLFESVRSVWHKEILAALAHGVRVIGAASMGALRAAECAAFGMEPVGVIAWQYVRGERTSDADVAVAHAGASQGYRALSEPQVNVDATLAAAVSAGELSADDGAALADLSRRRFYAERTWPWLLTEARRRAAVDVAALDRFSGWLLEGAVDQKALDARAALEAAARAAPVRPAPSWSLARTGYWEAADAEVVRRVSAGNGRCAVDRQEIELALDELRLDPRSHQLVSISSRARLLGERLHESLGLTISPADTRTALAELRRRLHLATACDVDRWRADEGLDTRAFRSLVTSEAKNRWASRRHLVDLERATITLLQRDGLWSALRARAAAKRALLARAGIDDVEATRLTGTDVEVLQWWWRSLGGRAPEDLDTYLADHHYDDPVALIRALRRERAYRELLSRH